jgi:hypothetical protein
MFTFNRENHLRNAAGSTIRQPEPARKLRTRRFAYNVECDCTNALNA